jgi:proline iminopeptidase
LERNKSYYSKFPEDVARVKGIVEYLKQNKITVPSGTLTPQRIQQLGIMFGMHGMKRWPTAETVTNII